MKKLIVIVCVSVLVLCLSSCGTRNADTLTQESENIDVSVQDKVSAEKDITEQSSQISAEPEDISAADTEKVSDHNDIEDVEVTEGTSPYENGQEIYLDESWEFADFSMIHSGCAIMYTATQNRKNIIIGVNAGHGTSGGSSVKTYCHPDYSAKTTGGTTSAGSVKAIAVSGGMSFYDGTAESTVTLQMAKTLKDKLLEEGYDVLMVRDSEDVQLDNVARTVICNNIADCHIALHWDGDGLNYDKGCFYCSVPDGIKNMYPVSTIWEQHEALGDSLISGLSGVGAKINGSGHTDIDLTQTSFSKVPSVDIELGNASSNHDSATLNNLADGLVNGINLFFGK